VNNAITDVPGIKVGHYTDKESATGCTVVLCEEGGSGWRGRARLGAGNQGDRRLCG